MGGADSTLNITQGKTLTPEPMHNGRRLPNFRGLFAAASRFSLPPRDRILLLPHRPCVPHSLLCTPSVSSAHALLSEVPSQPLMGVLLPLCSPSRVLEAGWLITQLLAPSQSPSLVHGTSSWTDGLMAGHDVSPAHSGHCSRPA